MGTGPVPDIFHAGDCGSTIVRNILRSLAMQDVESGLALIDRVLEHPLIRTGFRLAASEVILFDLETWLQGTDCQFEYNHVRLADQALSRLNLTRDWRLTKLLMSRAYHARDYEGAREVATGALQAAGKQARDEVVLHCSDILGLVCSAQGDFESAAKHWAAGAVAARKAELDSEEWNQRVGLIWCLQKLGQPLEALQQIDAAETIACRMEDCNAISKTLIDRGNTLDELGRWAEAHQAFAGALAAARVAANRARESDALGNLGGVAYAERDFAGAEKFHRQALEISLTLEDKKSVQYDLNNLAQALWYQGRSQEALEYEEEALAIARQRNDHQCIEQYSASAARMAEALGKSQKGRAGPQQRPARKHEQKDSRLATSECKPLAVVEKRVRSLLNERGPGEAKAFLEQHLTENPNDAHARALHAVLLVTFGDQKEALAQIEMAVGQAPDDIEVQFRRVDIYTEVRRLNELLTRYESAIADGPFRAALRVGLSLVYSRLGRTDEASQQAQEAVQLAPDEAFPLRVLAEAQFDIAMSRLRSDWDAAWTVFQDCVTTLNRLASRPDEQQGQWLYFTAQCLERFAMSSFETNPPLTGGIDSRELYMLAIASDRYREAYEKDRGRETGSDQNRVGIVIQTFGEPKQIAEAARYLRSDGNLDGAVVMLILSLQKEPKQGAAYYELACSMDAMGDRRGAREYILRALEFDPKNEEYQEEKRLLDLPPEKRPRSRGEPDGPAD